MSEIENNADDEISSTSHTDYKELPANSAEGFYHTWMIRVFVFFKHIQCPTS